MEQQYKADYEELQLMGRGNFGSAWLVRHKHENAKYIAKKVMLSGLKQKEKEAAMLEVNLLKNLNHQHIVAYKQSYFTLDQLIIIMEYCEVGDISYHIKRKIKNGEYFNEWEIFNWFIQICLALEYVHARRVIHRDLKTQNIFLTGNMTVKLGDFGISRVLENSNAAAMTVVGTPYYMSPEACQSAPYTAKSDVWSLGIILYELCTLKHPFVADNLLGLVFKIVQEKPDPIEGDRYSPELIDLISVLLQKDPEKRPSVRQILKTDLIRRKAQEFIEQNARQRSKTVVFKKKVPIVVKTKTGETEEEKKSDAEPVLTPKQKLALKKEREIQQQMEQMRLGASAAKKNYEFANERKLMELHAGMTKGPLMLDEAQIAAQGQLLEVTNDSYNPYSAGGEQMQYYKSLKGGLIPQDPAGMTQTINLSDVDLTINPSQTQVDRFQSPVMQQDTGPSTLGDSSASYGNDDKPIKAAGVYQLPQSEELLFDDYDEVDEAPEDEQLMEKVVDGFHILLEKQRTKIKMEKKDAAEELELQSQNSSSMSASMSLDAGGVDTKKNEARTQLGDKLYDHYYSLIYEHMSNPLADEGKFRRELAEQVGTNKVLQKIIFNLEMLVFQEVQKECLK